MTAAALVGSAAAGREDRWSDIDLALGLRAGVRVDDVAEVWTHWMREDHDAVDHLDVWAGPALYRVFLTGSSLQVDLSFWPAGELGARGPDFALVFGEEARDEAERDCDTGVVVLTCARRGLAWWEGRGADDLPSGDLELIRAARSSSWDTTELRGSLRLLLDLLLGEIDHVDPPRARRLRSPLADLVS